MLMLMTSESTLSISCDSCTMRASHWCADCVVTFICERPANEAVVLDLAEQRAVRLLADAGMVPVLRHREAI